MDAPPAIQQPPAIVAKADCLCKPTCNCNPCKCVRSPDDDYAAVYVRVMQGETVFTHYIPGKPPGYYRCWLEGGVCKFQAAPLPQAMPAEVPLFVPGPCPGGRCPVQR